MPVTSIELAEKIATELFSPYLEKMGDHLQIVREGRYQGGWGFEAAIAAIQKVIEENS